MRRFTVDKEKMKMFARKLFPVLVILTLLTGLFGMPMPAAAAGEIVVSYTLPASQVNPGDLFSVVVNIDVAPGTQFGGGQFNMSWNKDVLDLVSTTKGTYFSSCPNIASDFYNPPTINHSAGTMTNYSIAGLNFTAPGCTGPGVFATLNFRAIANGLSSQVISGIIMSNWTGGQLPADMTVFPGFNQYVGAAPRLVVTGVAFQPDGGTPPGTNFKTLVTVTNQGQSPSPANTAMNVTTDGKSTPATNPQVLPEIAGGASQTFTYSGYAMVAGQQSSVVTASIPDFSTSASNTYSPVSSQGQSDIDATFGAFIKVNTDPTVNFGQLSLGNNTKSSAINVQCNTDYQVTVSDANSTNWQMGEWTGTGFVPGGKKLQATLKIQATGFGEVTRPGGMLLSGDVAGQAPDSYGQTFGLEYKQTLYYGDPKLPAGETYHVILTFNAFVTA